MKNNLLKYYIAAFYLCSTFVMFSQGTEDENGTGHLEGDGDVTPAPINKYVLILALMGIIFVFMKFRTIQNKKVNG